MTHRPDQSAVFDLQYSIFNLPIKGEPMSSAHKDGAAADPFDPLGVWKAARDSGMEAWSKMMVDFINSDAYAHASAQWLDTYLTMSQSFQRAVDQAMTQTLGQYNIPTTADIVRLAERLTHIELRLDDLDARLDEVLALLRGLSASTAAAPPAADPAGAVGAPAEGISAWPRPAPRPAGPLRVRTPVPERRRGRSA
jgi:hypothetical protein